jgi:hypothetical protein
VGFLARFWLCAHYFLGSPTKRKEFTVDPGAKRLDFNAQVVAGIVSGAVQFPISKKRGTSRLFPHFLGGEPYLQLFAELESASTKNRFSNRSPSSSRFA